MPNSQKKHDLFKIWGLLDYFNNFLKLCILTETGFAATLKNVVQVDGVTPPGSVLDTSTVFDIYHI
jgi:hypothetical protein